MRLEAERIQQVQCSADRDAMVIEVVGIDGDDFCPPETEDVVVLDLDQDFALCLDFDQ